MALDDSDILTFCCQYSLFHNAIIERLPMNTPHRRTPLISGHLVMFSATYKQVTFLTSYKQTPLLNRHFFWSQGCLLSGGSTVLLIFSFLFHHYAYQGTNYVTENIGKLKKQSFYFIQYTHSMRTRFQNNKHSL